MVRGVEPGSEPEEVPSPGELPETQYKILVYLADVRFGKTTEMAERAGVAKQSIRNHLKQLLDDGLVMQSDLGNMTVYWLSYAGARVVGLADAETPEMPPLTEDLDRIRREEGLSVDEARDRTERALRANIMLTEDDIGSLVEEAADEDLPTGTGADQSESDTRRFGRLEKAIGGSIALMIVGVGLLTTGFLGGLVLQLFDRSLAEPLVIAGGGLAVAMFSSAILLALLLLLASVRELAAQNGAAPDGRDVLRYVANRHRK